MKRPKIQEDDEIISINQQDNQPSEYCSKDSIEQKMGKFDQFPNEMLDNIFKFLSPNDLADISLTCLKLKKLTESYFKRKLRCGCIKLKLFRSCKIERQKQEKYEIRFGSLIGDVYLRIETLQSSSLRKLFQIVQLNCTKNMRRLALDFILYKDVYRCQIDDFDIIAEQLTDLKMLYIQRLPIMERVLMHCKNLEILCMIRCHEGFINNYDTDWTNTIHPKLKVLIFIDYGLVYPNIDLIQFLLNAPELEAVTLNDFTSIRSFSKSNCKVAYAALWFWEPHQLVSVMDDIERMCKENRIESLHLGVYKQIDNVDVYNKIKHIPNLKSLHLNTSCIIGEDIFANAPIHPHIQTLCIRNRFNKQHPFNQIIKLYPNLDELHIIDHTTRNKQNLNEFIKAIACKHRHLKRIYVDTNKCNIILSNDDLAEINAARLILVEPSFLTIYTNVDVIDIKLKFVSVIKSDIQLGNCLVCWMSGFYVTNPDYEHTLAYLKTLPINLEPDKI